MGDKDLEMEEIKDHSCKSFWKGKQKWKKKVGEEQMGRQSFAFYATLCTYYSHED